MLQKQTIITLLLSFLLLPLAFAGSYTPVHKKPPLIPQHLTLNLRQAIHLALRRNPDIRKGYIQRIADQYSLKTAYWNYMPHYTFKASSNFERSEGKNSASSPSPARSLNSNVTPEVTLNTLIGTKISLTDTNPLRNDFTAPDSFNSNLTLRISQPLLSGFGRQIAGAPLNKAIISAKEEKYNFKSTIINTVTQVITDFHQVVLDQQTLKIQRRSVKNELQTMKNFEADIKAGSKAPASLNDIKATYYQDKIGLVNDKNNLASDKQNFLLLLGLNPITHLTLVDKLDYRDDKILTPQHAIHIALKHNIGFQLDLLTLASDRIALLLAQDKSRWQLNLIGQATLGGGLGNGLSQRSRNIFNNLNNNEQVTLNLAIPIDNLNLKGAIIDAQTGLAQQQIAVQTEKWKIETTVLNDIRQLKTDLQNIRLAILRRKYAYQSYQVTRKEVAVGRSTTFELTSKSLSLTNAAQAVVSAKVTYLDTYANFESELGITLKRWHLCVIL